jgi:hypothetical protein
MVKGDNLATLTFCSVKYFTYKELRQFDYNCVRPNTIKTTGILPKDFAKDDGNG